jgi:hypothetical protein
MGIRDERWEFARILREEPVMAGLCRWNALSGFYSLFPNPSSLVFDER